MSWTPGPWEAKEQFVSDEHVIVATAADPAYPGERFALTKPADARLIAAAPEMAEILEELEREADFLNTIPGFATQHAVRLLDRIRGEDQRPEGVA